MTVCELAADQGARVLGINARRRKVVLDLRCGGKKSQNALPIFPAGSRDPLGAVMEALTTNLSRREPSIIYDRLFFTHATVGAAYCLSGSTEHHLQSCIASARCINCMSASMTPECLQSHIHLYPLHPLHPNSQS